MAASAPPVLRRPAIFFGGAVVTIAGQRTEVSLFCMRAKASKVPFVIALPSEKLEAFLAGHVEAFEFFGGTFQEVWYDNAKTAVTKGCSQQHTSLSQHIEAHCVMNIIYA